MKAHTDNTITDPAIFTGELALIATQGYAVDEQEQEVGVRCVAVAVPEAPFPIALSVSGPAPRMTQDVVTDGAALPVDAAKRLASDLQRGAPD